VQGLLFYDTVLTELAYTHRRAGAVDWLLTTCEIPLSWKCSVVAAERGDMPFIEKLRATGSPWHYTQMSDAAVRNGQMEVLIFLASLPSFDLQVSLSRLLDLAGRYGHLDIMIWVHETLRVDWTETAMWQEETLPKKFDDPPVLWPLECMQYAREHGGSWGFDEGDSPDPWQCDFMSQYMQPDAFAYAHANGVPCTCGQETYPPPDTDSEDGSDTDDSGAE